MTQTLSAKEQSLAKIFSDDYVFTIPGYQRPYSWGRDQVQELLDDLLGALAASPNQLNEAAPYFLGSIVLIKHESSSEAIVVDGQQRLTTLTLLLSAIRSVVQDVTVQAGITKRIYEHGDVVSATQARYRLSLRDLDRDFFREYVQHENRLQGLIALNTVLPDSQSRLRANAKLFMEGLAKLEQPNLLRLVQFIVTRCYLVTVATPDLDSAYRIFGVMNSRGLDLTATDILKAEIIGGISQELRNPYTKKWDDAEEHLGRDGFSDLFSHIRMIYRKAKPQGTLLKEFKEHLAPEKKPKEFIDDVLLPMSQAFNEICDADYSSQKHAEQINEYLRWLNRLEFKDWLPPTLAFFVKNRNNPEAMLTFFRDMERLAYSMLIRKYGVNDRIERFSALTSAIEKLQDLEVASSPLQLSMLEQHEVYSALNGPIYESYSPRTLATIMLRLDHLISDGTASYKYDIVSVEHVLPQQPAPNSEWFSWVPDPLKHQYWVHRLGNLTLLSRRKNSSASNYEFDKKKNAYFNKGGICAFALTTEVLRHSDWTEAVMQGRQDKILKALETHWRLQDRKSKSELAEAKLAETQEASNNALFELESSRHGLSASAKENGSTFIVLAGSQAKREWSGQPHTYQQLRESLQSSGALQLSPDGAHLVFARDIDFKSPSAASATVLGRTDNGRNTWRLKGTSITYAAWQENLPLNQSVSGHTES